MIKNHYLLVVAMLIVASNSWSFRILQTWSDPNCAEWSQDGSICLKCIPRSYNNTEQNLCIRVDDNCKTWSETNGQCIKCYDSYGDAWKNGNAIDGKCPYYNGPQNQSENMPLPQLTPQIVQGYDVNCKCFSDQHECLECYKTYRLDDQGQCVPTTILNCKTILNETCVECDQGFYLNVFSECVELPANCTAADENGNCTLCAESFVLMESGECIPEILNCTKYTAQGTCQICDVGFYVTTSGQCQMLPANCLSADLTGQCTSCDQGYILSQGGCEELPKNCIETDENGICSKCTAGYYLRQNKMCEVLPANCTEASSNGQCTKCQQGYVIVNGECSFHIGQNPNCAQQDQKGQCTSCRNFYTLTNGNCLPTGENPFCKEGACECGTGKCLECQDGYFLDNNGICIRISQNCKQYSKLNGTCTSCTGRYVLIDGECVPSTKGDNVINLDCRTQDKNGKCLTCRRYYKLLDGDCIPRGINPKCHLWNQKKECQCCYYHDKYYLDNNNICSEKNTDCFQFNPQNGRCTQCLDGSSPKNGRCPPSSG